LSRKKKLLLSDESTVEDIKKLLIENFKCLNYDPGFGDKKRISAIEGLKYF
jgi:hypothetical protein